ncbi:MAG: hypothetical protein ACRDRI_03480 [Pseudonocardiaceae bacterium]
MGATSTAVGEVTGIGGTEGAPWSGAAALLWLRASDVLLPGAGSPSLTIVVVPRTALLASTKQTMTAALVVRVLAGVGGGVSRRRLAAAATALRRWGSAPIHAIRALAGGPDPALRRWRGASPCT